MAYIVKAYVVVFTKHIAANVGLPLALLGGRGYLLCTLAPLMFCRGLLGLQAAQTERVPAVVMYWWRRTACRHWRWVQRLDWLVVACPAGFEHVLMCPALWACPARTAGVMPAQAKQA